jgi:Icc-related predicted phosphoesterase
MQVLVVSDLHYGLQQLDWVAAHARDFDAVVFGGDHLDVVGGADLRAQIALFTAYFADLSDATVVIANSGNHDLSQRGSHGEKWADWMGGLDPRVVADGAVIELGDELISVCAWWEGPVTLGRLERQLSADAGQRREGQRWWWVYHSPPDRSPTSRSRARWFGDDVLNRLISEHRPDLVLAGHVHESPFQADGSWHDRIGSTTVLNAGRQRGPVPAHIVIDTCVGSATWWSSAGEATVPIW